MLCRNYAALLGTNVTPGKYIFHPRIQKPVDNSPHSTENSARLSASAMGTPSRAPWRSSRRVEPTMTIGACINIVFRRCEALQGKYESKIVWVQLGSFTRTPNSAPHSTARGCRRCRRCGTRDRGRRCCSRRVAPTSSAAVASTHASRGPPLCRDNEARGKSKFKLKANSLYHEGSLHERLVVAWRVCTLHHTLCCTAKRGHLQYL